MLTAPNAAALTASASCSHLSDAATEVRFVRADSSLLAVVAQAAEAYADTLTVAGGYLDGTAGDLSPTHLEVTVRLDGAEYLVRVRCEWSARYDRVRLSADESDVTVVRAVKSSPRARASRYPADGHVEATPVAIDLDPAHSTTVHVEQIAEAFVRDHVLAHGDESTSVEVTVWLDGVEYQAPVDVTWSRGYGTPECYRVLGGRERILYLVTRISDGPEGIEDVYGIETGGPYGVAKPERFLGRIDRDLPDVTSGRTVEISYDAAGELVAARVLGYAVPRLVQEATPVGFSLRCRCSAEPVFDDISPAETWTVYPHRVSTPVEAV